MEAQSALLSPPLPYSCTTTGWGPRAGTAVSRPGLNLQAQRGLKPIWGPSRVLPTDKTAQPSSGIRDLAKWPQPSGVDWVLIIL